MQQLDEPILTEALGEWLTGGEIRAILERRDRMGEIIDELVATNGELAVLLRYGIPPGAAPAVPARAAASAPAGDDLVLSLLTAANEAPIIAPSSELTWMGTLVALEDYEGQFRPIAEAGVRMGLTMGLLSGDEGLLCLIASERDLEPYERLRGLVGRDVEIFGVLADGTDMPVVQVTVSRVP